MNRAFNILIFFCFCGMTNAQVGIGTTTPHSSSVLDITSIDKGVLIPRMTESQRNSIGSPIEGLLVYQTDNTPGFYYHNGTGWLNISTDNNAWSKSGDSATNPTSNFIGTTDAQDLSFRTNNLEKMRLTEKGQLEFWNTGSSLFIGREAGENNDLSSNSNTFIGDRAGQNTVDGFNNVALGASALRTNSTGDYNSAIGTFSLVDLTTGNTNTALGYASLANLTTGISNVAIGANSQLDNVSGNHNVSIGSFSLYDNLGSFNTAIGSSALFRNTTGSGNVSIGGQSMTNNTTGRDNVSIGYNSMGASLTAFRNVAIGYSSMASNVDALGNVAVGEYALNQSNTSSSHGRNTAVGASSFRQSTTPVRNTGLGYFTGYNNTTGQGNTAIGAEALQNNQTGSYNVAIGDNAGQSPSGTSVAQNIYIGRQSGLNYVGDNNIMLGTYSGYDASGDQNIMIGENAGRDVVGDNNVFIGRLAGNALTVDNALLIENSGITGIDNALVYGEFDNDIFRINGEVQVGNPGGTGYSLPNNQGVADQILTTAGDGTTSWTTPSNPIPSIVKGDMNAPNQVLTGTTTLNFDNILIDTNGEYDIATHRFTATETGYYQVILGVHILASTASTFQLNVRRSNIKLMRVYQATATPMTSHNTSTIVQMNAGEFLEFYVNVGPSADTVTVSGFSEFTHLEIFRIDK